MREWGKYVREQLLLSGVEDRPEGEMVEEIAAQLEDAYMEALSAGASPDEADVLAREHVPDWAELAVDISRSKRQSAPAKVDRRMDEAGVSMRRKGGRWLSVADQLLELRYSARRLGKSFGLTCMIVLTLAVGIGANTAIFSVVNGVLLKPLPFDDPDRLVTVWASAPGMGQEIMPMSPAVSVTFEEESPVIEEIGLWTAGRTTILGGDEPTRVPYVSVTAGTFRVLRVQPTLGRRFTEEDDSPGSPATVILSHDYWQSAYGSDPSVIGQALSINGVPREIIGVMPEGVRYFQIDPAIYLPFRFNRASLFVGNFTFQCIARLAEGVTTQRAADDFYRLLPVAIERFPGPVTMEMLEEAQASFIVRPMREDIIGDVDEILWVLLGSVGIILIIACANVANLLLVRAETRERELAVRAAIGGSRAQVMGQFLVESLLLGLMGGALGLALAFGGLRALMIIAPDNLPRLDEVSVDSMVLLFTLGISLCSGLFFGIFPALRFGRIDFVKALKDGARGSGAGRQRHRARNGLVVAQMALALVLLVGSGLMIRSFQALRQVDPGFRNPAEVLTVRLTIPSSEIPDLYDTAAAHELIARRLGEVAGMTSVGLSTSITMDRAAGFDPIFVEAFPLPEGELPPMRRFKWIGPGYHEAMQNPVIAGRPLSWADIHARTRVVIVTQNLAREYWDDPAEAVGKRIGTGMEPGNWREIIGVVGDVRDDGITQPAVAVVYWPMVLEDWWPDLRGDAPFIHRTFTYVIRSPRVGTPDFLQEVKDAVWSVNSNLPVTGVRTMDDILRDSLARTSFTLVLLAIAAAVALLLGCVGVYGVISYVVSQRTREMGLRIALGAERLEVIGMVLRQGLLLTATGVFTGLVSAYGLMRLMTALLFEVSSTDPLTYAAVALILTVVALLACYLPARRAAGTDPMEALRAE